MDVLILSCGTGGGHNAAGTAIAEELKRRGHRVTMFNPYTQFDSIIPPHLLRPAIRSYMKHQGIHLPKTVFVATDYVCIPFTEETDCDAYIIPSPRLKTAFADCGLPAEKNISPRHSGTKQLFPKGKPSATPQAPWACAGQKIYSCSRRQHGRRKNKKGNPNTDR